MLAKEVIEQTGITKKALEYYENKKLLKPQRTAGNYRDYSPYDVLIIKKIMLLRSLNFKTEEIANLFNQPSSSLFVMKEKELEEEIYIQQTNLLYLKQCEEVFANANEVELNELIKNIHEDRQVKEEWKRPRFWERHHLGYMVITFGFGLLISQYFNGNDTDIAFYFITIGSFMVSDRIYYNLYFLYQELKEKITK